MAIHKIVVEQVYEIEAKDEDDTINKFLNGSESWLEHHLVDDEWTYHGEVTLRE